LLKQIDEFLTAFGEENRLPQILYNFEAVAQKQINGRRDSKFLIRRVEEGTHKVCSQQDRR
jgi:hypothetical protein